MSCCFEGNLFGLPDDRASGTGHNRLAERAVATKMRAYRRRTEMTQFNGALPGGGFLAVGVRGALATSVRGSHD